MEIGVFHAAKWGRVVNINLFWTAVGVDVPANGGMVQIGTLPEGWRPGYYISQDLRLEYGKKIITVRSTDGAVFVQNNGSTAISEKDRATTDLTFIATH